MASRSRTSGKPSASRKSGKSSTSPRAGGKRRSASSKSTSKKAATGKKKRSKAASKRSSSTAKRRTAAPARARGGAVKPGRSASASAAPTRARGGDFGIGSDNPAAQREASEISKRRPGAERNRDDRQPRAGVDSREAGVGGREGGAGSFSGGDLDTDLTGVGAGGVGIAQSGPDELESMGQAESTGGSKEFASGGPARGRNQGSGRGRVGGSKRVPDGSTVPRSGDFTTTGEDVGAVGFTEADDTGAGHADMGEIPHSGAARRPPAP